MRYDYGKIRKIDGLLFQRCCIFEHRDAANTHANYLRGKGVLVRLIQERNEFALYTR